MTYWGFRGVVLLLVAASGCANVCVKKVPVADRACGADKHVHGFRYYLSRPYIVVKERVPVSYEAIPAWLVYREKEKGKKPEFALMPVDCPPGGSRRMFDLTGVERPELSKPIESAPWKQFKDAPKMEKEIGKLTPVHVQATNPPFAVPNPKLNKSLLGAAGDVKDDATVPAAAFQVVNIPDFEEQYAIKNVNFLAESQYDYTFSNGMLVEATGSYNSTAVIVQFLRVLQQAIGAGAALEKARIESLPVPGGTGAAADVADPQTSYYVVFRETFIEPGIYRVQKSWEQHATTAEKGIDPACAAGLLTDVGLPTEDNVTILTATEFDAFREKLPKPSPPVAP